MKCTKVYVTRKKLFRLLEKWRRDVQKKLSGFFTGHDPIMPSLQNLGGSFSDLLQVLVMGKRVAPKRQTVAMAKCVPKSLASPSEPVGVAAQHRSETMRGLSKLRAPKARKSLY